LTYKIISKAIFVFSC